MLGKKDTLAPTISKFFILTYFLKLLAVLPIALVGAYITLIVIWSLFDLTTMVAFSTSLALLIASTALIITNFVNRKWHEEYIRKELYSGNSLDTVYDLFGLTIMATMCFITTSYSGWHQFGALFINATIFEDNLISWISYGLDNLIRAVLFDFAEVYRLDLSVIEHADTFWAATFVFCYRTIMSLTIVSVLISSIRTIYIAKTLEAELTAASLHSSIDKHSDDSNKTNKE